MFVGSRRRGGGAGKRREGGVGGDVRCWYRFCCFYLRRVAFAPTLCTACVRRERRERRTPFGEEVVPEVKRISAGGQVKDEGVVAR